jgi:hypothetical protein
VNLKEAQMPITSINLAAFDIDVFGNVMMIKQNNFSRDPKDLIKLPKSANCFLTYEPLDKLLKPRYGSLIEQKAKELTYGGRRNYYTSNETSFVSSTKSRTDIMINNITENFEIEYEEKNSAYYQKHRTSPYSHNSCQTQYNFVI